MEQRGVTNHDEILLEELFPTEDSEHFIPVVVQAKGRDVLRFVTALLRKVNHVKISVWHKESPLVSIPSLYGGVMAALFPLLSVFSLISLLALDCRIIVEKRID